MITHSDFKPPWYLKNPHLQTLIANFSRPTAPRLTFEALELDDGDNLELAWSDTRGPETVLLLHGLEGSLSSSYAVRLLRYLDQHEVPAVMMFFRGCNGKPNRRLRSYHSGDTGDLKQVILHLKKSGIQRIGLVGYSLGGNVTLKYMGEAETDESICCATAISVPLLLADCASRMDRGFSRVYQFALLKRLIKKVQQKQPLFEQAGIYTAPGTMKNFLSFDDTYTAPVHGFDSAQDYYQRCSSRQFLKGIKKPTLILHAEDDPFMTQAVIPTEQELSAQVTLELSDHGGHVGFISGNGFKPFFWLQPRILKFLQQNLFRT